MKEDAPDISRAETYAHWIIRNISSLESMLDKPGEKNHFLDRLTKHVEGRRKPRVVPIKPGYIE